MLPIQGFLYGIYMLLYVLCMFQFGYKKRLKSLLSLVFIRVFEGSCIRCVVYILIVCPYYEEIFSTTLKSYEGRLFLEMMYSNKTKWILPHSTPHTTTINSSVAFCPSCFKKDENPYFRKHWRLSIAILCTECGVYLQDKCPACNEPIKFDTTGFTIKNGHYKHSFKNCFNCQFDLSKAPVQLAPTKYLKKQIELYRIIKEGWNEKVIYPHLYFDVLHHILKLIKGKELFLINTLEDFKVPFEQLSIDLRKQYLTIAIWILEDFPKRFIRITQKEKLRHKFLKGFENIPFWYYEAITVYKLKFPIEN